MRSDKSYRYLWRIREYFSLPFRCLIHLPKAWLRALKAWISYHCLPCNMFSSFDLFLSLYFIFSSTLGSFQFGKGIPTHITARALLSAKSSPSLTFPRHTAIKSAPSTLSSSFVWRSLVDSITFKSKYHIIIKVTLST